MEDKRSIQFKIAAIAVALVCAFGWMCEMWPRITRNIARTSRRAYTSAARTVKISVRPYTGGKYERKKRHA